MKELESFAQKQSEEITTKNQQIVNIKERIAVYIPVKNDSIDTKLAEYINNYPD